MKLFLTSSSAQSTFGGTGNTFIPDSFDGVLVTDSCHQEKKVNIVDKEVGPGNFTACIRKEDIPIKAYPTIIVEDLILPSKDELQVLKRFRVPFQG
jgi:hypothetical protein